MNKSNFFAIFLCILDPINSFQAAHQTDNEPIRLSYHRGVHYNSLVDPYKVNIVLLDRCKDFDSI